MSICWYCHWGWPKAVADIYKEALCKLNGNRSPLHFGASHIVWEDENFDLAESCLKDFSKYKGFGSKRELSIVEWSLEMLIKIPIKDRCVEPEDYDGENPELFPPKTEMVKI
jgi:hypothetical protein